MKKFAVAVVVVFALLLSLVVLPISHAQKSSLRVSEEKSPAKNPKTKSSNKNIASPHMLRAARAQEDAPAPVSVQAVAFAVTAPVAELEPDKGPGTDVADATKVTVFENDVLREAVPGEPGTPDAALQTSVPSAPSALSPAPATNFDGISNTDNATFGLGRVLPPDTNGDVGPNHYVQSVNSLARIFQKNGTPVGNPFRISTLFTALPAANVCRTTDNGDPIVLYDELADRWVISQFSTTANPNTHQCIAVSKTGDPAGQYYVYDFQMPNNKFNDYPHFGTYPDAYYMTDNQFNQAGTAFQGAGVFAFNRQKMLVGDATANFIYFDLASNVGGMLPADADGLVAPPAGASGYFAQFNANEFGDPSDAMVVWQFHADFNTPANSTFTQRADSPVALAAFDPRSPSGRNIVEQPAPGISLDVIQDRLMNRIQYRNFGSYESLIISHTVNVGATPTTTVGHQAAVRYYEMRRPLPGGNFTVPEQATFAPDTDNRWMPSAAMDNRGNLAVGYSVSSTATKPSIRYAGRLASDPANTLAQGETTLIAGTGVQTHSTGRWGDYSSMNVDPTDDCTFWFSTEYYTTASQASSTAGWVTRIGSFKFPTCTAPAQGTLSGTITNCNTGLPVAGAIVQVSDGHSRVADASGNYSVNLPPGSYTLSASAAGFGTLGTTSVSVTNGNTTNANLCLQGIPSVQTAGSAVTAESCSPADNALSPGENVSMNFGLKNTGTGNTTNLVATLLSTGGVTFPSGPQSYGALVAGGPIVNQPFSFTVDPSRACGGVVIATLQLQDGSNNLGTVSFPLTVGALGAVATSTYTSGNIATAIPDVSSVDIPITVSNTGSLTDVNLKVRLNHTFDGDLTIKLIHPDGTIVSLSERRGSSGQNFGTGANDCSATTFTVFDDSAAASITGGVAPFSGSFRPETVLSAFNGKPSNGVWKLRISDEAALDTGTVGCVQLELTRQKFVCCGTSGPALMEAVPPAVLVSESATPANNAPDPDETVTMNFPLRNVGDGATNNLVATLLATGGVNAPNGPQTYGVVQPTGVPVSKPFTFVARGACGSNITATLHLQDGATDLGNVTYTIRLGSNVTNSASFSNAAPILIPAGQPATTSGAATPYPSIINVSGVSGTVSKVTVQLKLMNHTFPDDIDALLVGPGGQRLLLMSDVGGTNDLINTNLTLDDAAAASLSDSGANPSGTYKPTNIGTGDTLPATGTNPPPVGPYPDPQLLSVFNAANPNGAWRLYITDDVGGDFGNINGGWQLNITTSAPACTSQACTLNAPSNVVQGSDPGQYGAIVNYPAPTLSGNCGVVTTSQASGTFFPVGTTTVTVTATRADNTTTTRTFTVNVNDTETPVISCPANITVSNDAGACSAVVNPGSPTASDNDPQFATGGVRDDSQPLNAPYSKGTTTITWTATDRAGRSASCIQTITVNDTQNPTISAPSNIVVSNDANACSASVNPGTPTINDNCSGATFNGVRSDSQPLNAAYPKGLTTIVWTVTDASNNTATATQTITVNDTENPTITAPSDINTGNDAGSCSATLNPGTPTVNDNCTGATFNGVRDDSQPLSAPYSKGTTIITWTATDASGNTASATQTVKVNDTEKPTITAPSSVVVANDANACSANVNPGAPTVNDNCSGATFNGVRSDSQPLNAPYPIGATTITWTATDASNNTATALQLVTVNDTQNPTISAPPNRVVSNDANACSATLNPGTPTVSDNCPGATFNGLRSDSQPLNAAYPKGTTTIVWTVTDASGNTASANQTVIVNDTQNPTISAPSNIVVTNDANACSASLNPGTPTVNDNCPGATFNGVRSDSQPLNASYPIGTTTITWTATDASGNTATASQTVKVNDTQAPSVGTVTATPSSMWPPNHQMVNVTVNYSNSDNCPGSNCVLTVTSNEPINGLGDGDTAPDWVILDNHHVQLRAERSGKGNGRIYTIKVTCTDAAGNSTVKTTTVNVPHN